MDRSKGNVEKVDPGIVTVVYGSAGGYKSRKVRIPAKACTTKWYISFYNNSLTNLYSFEAHTSDRVIMKLRGVEYIHIVVFAVFREKR